MDSNRIHAEQEVVHFTYYNHRGETAIRQVRPSKIAFGTSQWHPEPQWLLTAWDIEKNAERTFALNDISNWNGH